MILVAGPGFRSPVKQDYEPCEIPTSPPHIKERGNFTTKGKISRLSCLGDLSCRSDLEEGKI